MNSSKCFVCDLKKEPKELSLNKAVYLYVCDNCKGSDEEKKKVDLYLDSLADGLVCGCI